MKRCSLATNSNFNCISSSWRRSSSYKLWLWLSAAGLTGADINPLLARNRRDGILATGEGAQSWAGAGTLLAVKPLKYFWARSWIWGHNFTILFENIDFFALIVFIQLEMVAKVKKHIWSLNLKKNLYDLHLVPICSPKFKIVLKLQKPFILLKMHKEMFKNIF